MNTASKAMIKKSLLPVAVDGTRFLPATKAMPKAMLPIGNKALVQYGIEEAVETGIHGFDMPTELGQRAIDFYSVNFFQ